MKIRHIEVGTAYRRNADKTRTAEYYLSIHTYTLWKLIRYRVYHKYDMMFVKIPFLKWLYQFLDRHFPKQIKVTEQLEYHKQGDRFNHNNKPSTFPLSRFALQDFRCHDYSKAYIKESSVSYLAITKEQFLALGGKQYVK